jgi:hypothetical protein
MKLHASASDTLCRGLVGPQSRSEHCGDEKIHLSWPKIEPRFLCRPAYPIALPTELLCLPNQLFASQNIAKHSFWIRNLFLPCINRSGSLPLNVRNCYPVRNDLGSIGHYLCYVIVPQFLRRTQKLFSGLQHFSGILPFLFYPSNGHLQRGFPIWILYTLLITPIWATFLAHSTKIKPKIVLQNEVYIYTRTCWSLNLLTSLPVEICCIKFLRFCTATSCSYENLYCLFESSLLRFNSDVL